MRIIIPMAGRGSRLRPHTLTVPKPLIPIAGKPIVERLAEDITALVNEDVHEIAFIIGDFGKEVEDQLLGIAKRLGAEGSIYRQDEPLGTAHALYQARASLRGPVIIAFADTLFTANFVLDKSSDGVIWVKKVDDPSAFGVAKLDEYGMITDFVEKPKEFVSDLAIIGIYYFKNGEDLRDEIDQLLDQNITGSSGEYQLTDVMDSMLKKGRKFTLGKVNQWMDCGNKTATIDTNNLIMEIEKDKLSQKNPKAKVINSLIIPPCFIGDDVQIENSKIGPYVSIGNRTIIRNSNIDHSLIQEDTQIEHGNLTNSMIGNHAKYYGVSRNISLGDYSSLDFNSK